MMNPLSGLAVFCFCIGALFLVGCAQQELTSGELVRSQVVEASCGQCKFGMEGTGCDLAIRIGDQSYYVDGFSIDDFGDAHADDGFCNAVRQARVSGKIENGRFVATQFELLPDQG